MVEQRILVYRSPFPSLPAAEHGDASLSWDITANAAGMQVCMYTDVVDGEGIHRVWPEDDSNRKCSEYLDAAAPLSTAANCVPLTEGLVDSRSLRFPEQEAPAYWWAALVNCREDLPASDNHIEAHYRLEFTNAGGIGQKQVRGV